MLLPFVLSASAHAGHHGHEHGGALVALVAGLVLVAALGSAFVWLVAAVSTEERGLDTPTARPAAPSRRVPTPPQLPKPSERYDGPCRRPW